MTLKQILRLDEIADCIEKYKITVQKSNIGIKFVTENNVIVYIHKQTHCMPEDEPLIYLDCMLRAYGLPEFRRNWHENENLSDYLVKTVFSFIANLAGPFTQDEHEVDLLIIEQLNKHGINIDENKRIDLKSKIIDSLGNEIESTISNRPVISFHVKESRYGIVYHKAFLDLLIFKSDEDNEILLSYPWYSFCSIFLKGSQYVGGVVDGIMNFINNKIDF